VQTLLIATSAQLAVYQDLSQGLRRIAETRFDATPVVLEAEVDAGLHQLLLVHCAGRAQDIVVRYDSMVHPSGVSSAVLAIRAMSSHTEPATHAHLTASFMRVVSGAPIGAGVSPDLAVLEIQTALQRLTARFGVEVPGWLTAVVVLKRLDHAVCGTVLEEMGSVATRSGLDISLLLDKLQARFMATKGRSTTVAAVSVEAHAVQLAAQQRVQRMAERSHTDAMKPTLPGGGGDKACVKCGVSFRPVDPRYTWCTTCNQSTFHNKNTFHNKRRAAKEVSANLATVTVDDRESFYPYSPSLELSGFAVTVDGLPGGSPTRSLLAVCGVDGSLGENAMPVMHNDAAALCDAEPDVVQALYAELPVFNYEPVLDVPTFHDDSVYTGIHHDYGADKFTLPDTISDGVPFPVLNWPTFPVLDKPTLHDDGADMPSLPGAVSDGDPPFISNDVHHDYGANMLTLPGTVVDGVPPLHAASDDAGEPAAGVVTAASAVGAVASVRAAGVVTTASAVGAVASARAAGVVTTASAVGAVASARAAGVVTTASAVGAVATAPAAGAVTAASAAGVVATAPATGVATAASAAGVVATAPATGVATAASAFDASELPWSHPYWEDSEELDLTTGDEPCAAAPVRQDAASSYLATGSLDGPAVWDPLGFAGEARAPIVDTKSPPVWLAEPLPSPPASMYHDDVLVVHGEAGVLPGAAAVMPAGTGGDLVGGRQCPPRGAYIRARTAPVQLHWSMARPSSRGVGQEWVGHT
jgi:hypothetical protein